MRNQYLFLLILLFLFTSTFAQTKYVSVTSGKWEQESTWSPQGTPGISDTVVISTGTEVTINANSIWASNIKIAKLIVEQDAKLSINNGISFWGKSGISHLYVYDSLRNDGIIEGDINSSSYPVQILAYKSLDGTGTFKIVGFYFSNDKVTIEKNADLTFYISVIVINTADTVENYGKIFTDYHIVGSSSSSTWINKSGSYLTVGDYLLNTGTLICSEPDNTIKYAPVYGDINIKIPQDSTYYNLYTEGSDTTFLYAPYIYINNDFSILGSSFNAQANKIYVRGDWLDKGEFYCNSCTVIFDGSQDQTIEASAYETFDNLVLKNYSYKVNLKSDIIVNDTLTLNTTVENNDNLITLGISALQPGQLIYQSGKIKGEFKRWVNASSAPLLYPIGSNDFETFVNITFPAISTPGYVSFRFVDTMPSNNGLPLQDGTGATAVNVFGDGYWIADTSSGFSLGSNTYDISLTGNAFTAYTINDSTKIVVRPDKDSTWRFDGTQGINDATNYTVARTSLANFPYQFALADTTNCSPPVLTQILGPVDVCRGDAGVIYSTDENSGYTYFWSINGGSIVQNNDDSVTVDWVDNGQYATISVYAQNTCSFGNTLTKTVRIHSIPPSYIYGPRSVPVGSDSVFYHIDPLDNYSYTGAVRGNAVIDSINAAQDSAWISFPVAGTDTILVIAQYDNGCPTDTAFFSVYVYDAINSVKSGDWYDPSTWDCNCQPLITDNVRIRDGHTVVVDRYVDENKGIVYNSYEINNVIVDKGGILTHIDGYTLNIDGDIVNNGVIEYRYQNLQLKGTDKSIDGLGIFNVDTIDIQGSHNISANANITVNGNIKLNNNYLNNTGKLMVKGDIIATTGTLVNGKNAKLSVKGSLMDSGGELIADSTDNTVSYIGGNQSIKQVSTSSSGYFNIIFAGNGTKTLSAALTVLNDLIIQDTAILDANNYNITVGHDWYEISQAADPFLAGTGTVFFNGNGEQYLYSDKAETFYDMQIEQYSTLNILPKQHFTVSNNLTINGTLKLIMESAQDTLSSFIYQNDIIYGINGKVEADLFMDAKHWHEVSPAIAGLTSATFTRAITNTFNPNFYWYDESVDLDGNTSTEPDTIFDNSYLTAGWKYAHNGASGADIPLNLNSGYMFYIDRDMTIPMSGQAAKVSVDYDTTLSYTANDPDLNSDTLPNLYDGWNLIGNPYTAYLSVDSILNNAVNIGNGVYIWDDYNGQYAGYQNGFRVLSGELGNLIPPLQAFFVRANAAGATVKIRPEYRTHGSQKYMKSTNSYKQNAVKIGFEANGKTEYLATYFYKDASVKYNSNFDLVHLASSKPENPKIYSIKDNIKLALYSLPDSATTTAVIPVYIEDGLDGNYKLTVEYINGLDESFVLLKDLKNNTFYNLKNNREIQFEYKTEDAPHRFDLVIAQNHAPVSKELPNCTAYEDSSFTLDLSQYFHDSDSFDTLNFIFDNLPSWLKTNGYKLEGTPQQKDVGKYTFAITAYDMFFQKTEQIININVLNTNDPPEVEFSPEKQTVFTNNSFEYTIPANMFTDPDPDDNLQITAVNLPSWLNYDKTEGILTGTPEDNDIGTYNVTFQASDLAGATATTELVIDVLSKNKVVKLYPNPARDVITIVLGQNTQNAELTIYGSDGKKYKEIAFEGRSLKTDISELKPGLYIMEIRTDAGVVRTKLTKI